MSNLQERRLAFIHQYVMPYVNNPSLRAKDSEGAVYFDKATGNKCVIGQLIPEEHLGLLEGTYVGVRDSKVSRLLPDWAIQLEVHFLEKCQRLHDNGRFWDAEGLSQKERGI